jgi:hypothetical protein
MKRIRTALQCCNLWNGSNNLSADWRQNEVPCYDNLCSKPGCNRCYPAATDLVISSPASSTDSRNGLASPIGCDLGRAYGKMTNKLVYCLVLSIILIGCTPLERTAYDLAVASKAFLNSIQAAHTECSLSTFPAGKATLCLDLLKAVAAQHLLVDAGEAYCNQATFGVTSVLPCKPSPSGTGAATRAVNALNQAISGYRQAESDLKAVSQ